MDKDPDDTSEVIVLVEEHDDTRELMRDFLELQGHTVIAHRDGTSALGAIRRMPSPPSLILLDLGLPLLNGFDLLRQLGADPALACVPVLLTTACETDRIAHLRLPFLRKPFEPTALLHAVQQHRSAARRAPH